jgi:hypothetical protein
VEVGPGRVAAARVVPAHGPAPYVAEAEPLDPPRGPPSRLS